MSKLNERYVAMTQKRKHVLMLRYRNICHDGIGQPDQAKRRIAIRFALWVYPQPHPLLYDSVRFGRSHFLSVVFLGCHT